MNISDQNNLPDQPAVPGPPVGPIDGRFGVPADPWAALALGISFTGGFRLSDIEQLVRTAGAQRAGSRVIEGIEQHLADNLVGHLPGRLPTDSTCKVLLYSKNAPNIGYVLSVIHALATEDANEDTNARVHQLESMLRGITQVSQAQHMAVAAMRTADGAPRVSTGAGQR
ncbi:hypothetical protein ACGFZP_31710 [Kitasatospora sp. NPDC048239]|uniref:hypothetical protein n=1 Tax=Kitasatospora sp. NPDC048239 TaxID=3364046 RepID=UPI003710EB8C